MAFRMLPIPNSRNNKNKVIHVDAIKPLLEFAKIKDNKKNKNKNTSIKNKITKASNPGSVK